MLSWEKPLVKPMAPGSLSYYIASLSFTSHLILLFYNLYLPIYATIIPKIFTLLSLLDLTFASDSEGIDNPYIALVARSYLFCAGTRDACVASYWIDTLVLKNWGKYLRYFVASPFPLQGKTNACSRGSTHHVLTISHHNMPCKNKHEPRNQYVKGVVKPFTVTYKREIW